jgi:hypothetical protein
MTHHDLRDNRQQSGRYCNTGATAEQWHTLTTQTQEVTMSKNRYTEAERLVSAALRLARLNLKEDGAFVGRTRRQAYELIDDAGAEILSALADQLDAEASTLSGGAR